MGTQSIPERRSALRLLVVATAALALLLTGVAPAAAAGPEPASGNVVTVGSYYHGDPGFAALMSYCNQAAGTTTDIHAYDRGAFQDNIEAYLRGTPDSVVTWFGGYRMRYLANRGLLTPISDVWTTVGANYADGMKVLSTGSDGEQYLIPLYEYPWVVLYRKSVFAAHGYTVPTTMSEFRALAAKMKSDGLVPLALGDKDGWPAMSIFDILDMRLNGYDFHMGLLTGTEKWTDPKVKAVFEQWKSLLPYMSPHATNKTWQEAASDMLDGTAGMYFMGTFASAMATDPAVLADLDMFPFPVFGNAYDAEMAIDAPVDGLMLSTANQNLSGAKQLLACAASGPAQLTYLAHNSGNVAAVQNASTAAYTTFQKRMAAVIGSANRIAQFMDRDSRPDFMGPAGMQGFLQSFLDTPGQDLDAYLSGIQAYWDALPGAAITPLPTWLSANAIPLSWDAATLAAAASYDVRYRQARWNGGFGPTVSWRSATNATRATFSGSPGYTYCFSARARFAGGASSTWTSETCTAIPLDDRSLTRTGSWTAGSGAAYYRSTYLRSSASGATLTRSGVVARRIALLATTCATCGTVKVYLGSTLLKTISLHSSTTVNSKVISVASFTSTRTGTLRIEVSSSGKKVTIDGVAIRRN